MTFDPVTFEWPIVLVGLALLPLLLVLHVLAERRRVRSQAAFGNPDLLPNVVERSPGRLRYLPLVLLLLALGTMIVGVARPHATVTVPREEATVVIAMDTSRSMKAQDVPPTRLEAAVGAAKAFVAQVPEKYRVGVVSFASRAEVGVPPTDDRVLVSTALDSLVPGEGTAIGDAVALAIRIGRQQETAEGGAPAPRAILLVSDGKRDGGTVNPADAAAEARQQGIPVHTVLVGTPNGVLEELLPGGFRRLIQVPPDPQTLQLLSQSTGGTFFTAFDEAGLQAVYEELGSRLGERKEQREVTDVVAAGAAALLLVGGALSAFLFRRVP